MESLSSSHVCLVLTRKNTHTHLSWRNCPQASLSASPSWLSVFSHSSPAPRLLISASCFFSCLSTRIPPSPFLLSLDSPSTVLDVHLYLALKSFVDPVYWIHGCWHGNMHVWEMGFPRQCSPFGWDKQVNGQLQGGSTSATEIFLEKVWEA